MPRILKNNPATVRLPYILLTTLGLLLIPLIVMQFSDSINWTALDFIAAGILLLAAGYMGDLLIRNIKSGNRRFLALLVLAIVFVYLWVELAVGILFNFSN